MSGTLLSVERWIPVPGWEGLYEVSDLGRVQSLPRLVKTRGVGLRTSPGRILKPGTYNDGHKHVTFTRPGLRMTYQVHKLIMLAFVGPCPDGLQIRHLDGMPDNNRLDNLLYGTIAENAQDRIAHGRDKERRKTHCPKGHPYDEVNTYVTPAGHRQCRTCRDRRLRSRNSR